MTKIDPVDGSRALAAAILLMALRDSKANDTQQSRREARWARIPPCQGLAGSGLDFLLSPGARWILAQLEMDPKRIPEALARVPAPKPGPWRLEDLLT